MAEYIEREALKQSVRMIPRTPHPELLFHSSVQKVISNAPAADVVEVRYGHWINDICSVCRVDLGIYDIDWFNYCPFCGAKMDGKDNVNE